MAPEESYYGVLEVPFDASKEEIRLKYFGTIRTVHPDKSRQGKQTNEGLERYHQVQTAFHCLGDDTRRLLYDLRNFGHSTLGGEDGDLAKLIEMQKKQASTDMDNMSAALDRIIRREQAKGGIIIKRALYGDLRLKEDRLVELSSGKQSIEESDLQGPFIEVTKPVQFLVEQHTILINGGGQTSKGDLQGFYNPAPLDTELELELYVLYLFKGKLHEVIVGDREMLSLPRRAHAVTQVPRGPYAQGNVSLLISISAMKAAGRSSKTCAAPAQRGSTSSSSSPKAASKVASKAPQYLSMNPRKVLERAVVSYRLAALKPPCAESATPREFAVIALCSGVTVALLAGWARWGGRDR